MRLRSARPLLMLLGAMAVSCSLLIQHNTEQCQSDGDCSQFADAVCDLGGHVCVAKSGATSSATTSGSTSVTASSSSGAGGGSCEGDAGCWNCVPKTTVQFLNACTNAACKPFDDAARCKNLTADGGLPPIPDAGAD